MSWFGFFFFFLFQSRRPDQLFNYFLTPTASIGKLFPWLIELVVVQKREREAAKQDVWVPFRSLSLTCCGKHSSALPLVSHICRC